jgi:hypothetical protein
MIYITSAYTSPKEGISMFGLWAATIGFLVLFFAMVFFFILAIKGAVNSEDAYVVDKLPEKENDADQA